MNNPSKKTIVVFTRYYIPGFLGGGPIRSIANMVETLGDEYSFLVITGDRDLGCNLPYPNIKIDEWNVVGRARVFYASSSRLTIRSIAKILQKNRHDIIYLNSFFDPLFTILPLAAINLGLVPRTRIILAPRGELSEGALSIKRIKKKIYITTANTIGFYKKILFHASTYYEALEIASIVKTSATEGIESASDISKTVNNIVGKHDCFSKSSLILGKRGQKKLKICFLSRISPKKNLDYALKALLVVKAEVEMNVYGPIEDEDYWHTCKRIIESLPKNVTVNYLGSVAHENVAKVFQMNDLFCLPTLGENFGHVFIEAWSAGLPILISDRTPWRKLMKDNLGWDLSLKDPLQFSQVINEAAVFDEDRWVKIRESCLHKASIIGDQRLTLEEYRSMFDR